MLGSGDVSGGVKQTLFMSLACWWAQQEPHNN
jgi:hypothetical protein